MDLPRVTDEGREAANAVTLSKDVGHLWELKSMLGTARTLGKEKYLIWKCEQVVFT